MLNARYCVLLTTLSLAACDKNAPPEPHDAPRPVEVYSLSEIDPSRPLELSGSVSSWKEQDVGFEVNGRIRFVQEPSTGLEGRWEEDGKVRVVGQLLAEIDDKPYRIAVANALASQTVAREQLGVAIAEIEKVLPANLRAAKAEEAQAKAEYERYQKAGKSESVSVIEVMRKKADREVATANVAQAEALFDKKRAEKRSLEAQLAEAGERLEQAQWELSRCKLYAPFSGEVSSVAVEAGGYVRPGQPVAHIVMMDPIQVDVAVSAKTMRKLYRYSDVRLRVPGIDRALTGRIYDLATVADPKTRTFRVSMILRNLRRSDLTATPGQEEAKARVERFLVPIRIEHTNLAAPFFVESRESLRKDAQGWFVWALPSEFKPGERSHQGHVLPAHKIRVTPGDRLVNYQGIYVMRELVDAGGLTAQTVLPLGLPDDFPEGGKVLLAESGWSLQPGQIVSVLLDADAPAPGIYLPMNVILPDKDGFGRIYVEQEGRAHSVRITLGKRAGELVGVSAADDKDAKWVGPGARVIRQPHFVHEGETIRIVRTHEVRP